MIRHTILFKTKSDASPSDIRDAIRLFLNLKNQLSGVMTMMGGKCRFNEKEIQNKASRIFDYSISIDFTSVDDLENFFENPITHPAKGAVINIAEGGYEGVIGFEVID